MPMYLRVAICDDDEYVDSEIEGLLLDFGDRYKIKFDITLFSDGKELIDSYKGGESYDLLYLDIEMKELNGLETARIIRNIDKLVLIIYVSGHKSYISELFEVTPFRFISKPINSVTFYSYLKMAIKKIRDCDAFFLFEFNKDLINIPIREIIYFESRGNIIQIVLENRTYTFYKRLDLVEADIKENYSCPFIRIHKSFLVNYIHIRKISYSRVEMSNGKELRISENRQKKTRDLYSEICMMKCSVF